MKIEKVLYNQMVLKDAARKKTKKTLQKNFENLFISTLISA
jgi:hypothetical protein